MHSEGSFLPSQHVCSRRHNADVLPKRPATQEHVAQQLINAVLIVVVGCTETCQGTFDLFSGWCDRNVTPVRIFMQCPIDKCLRDRYLPSLESVLVFKKQSITNENTPQLAMHMIMLYNKRIYLKFVFSLNILLYLYHGTRVTCFLAYP